MQQVRYPTFVVDDPHIQDHRDREIERVGANVTFRYCLHVMCDWECACACVASMDPSLYCSNHVFHAIGGRLKLSSCNNFEMPCRVLQNVLYKWCDAPHQSTGQKNHIEEIRDVTKLMQDSFV